MKAKLPYLSVSKSYDDLSSTSFDALLKEGIAASKTNPHYLEVSDASEHRYLFFRDGQLYSAGAIENEQYVDTNIKDSLVALNELHNPKATLYAVNSKILHSLLIIFQKKSTLKLLTSLVDLDEVLDKIEAENKSCIVCASQDDFLALLRYEKGQVTALCHEESSPTPREKSFREDFLVQIYTLSAEKPLNITVYEDLLVRYASDAQMIDDTFNGQIADRFLTKPPTVTLRFKGKDLGHWVLDRPELNIGRTNENDIPIDNLAVSRLHAVLEQDKGHFYVRDCDSLNGTTLNGQRVGRSRLNDGDVIAIGKHELVFSTRSGRETPLNPEIAPFDQTMVITPGQGPNMTPPPMPQASLDVGAGDASSGPRLVEKNGEQDHIFELNKDSLVFGKDEFADIELDGLLIAKQHAEIVVEDGECRIRHLNGFRRVSVDGKKVKERVLKDNDRIRIGKREFIFHE